MKCGQCGAEIARTDRCASCGAYQEKPASDVIEAGPARRPNTPRPAPIAPSAPAPGAPSAPAPGAPADPAPGAPADPAPGAPADPAPGAPVKTPASPPARVVPTVSKKARAKKPTASSPMAAAAIKAKK